MSAFGASPAVTAYMHVQDQKPSGTGGGSSVTGVNIRNLNTVVANTIVGASLAANQVTLPAGTYAVIGGAPALDSNGHRTYLYNVSAGSTAVIGSTVHASSADTTSFDAPLYGRFVIETASVFELRHYIISGGVATLGLGPTAQSGHVEVYGNLLIEKVE